MELSGNSSRLSGGGCVVRIERRSHLSGLCSHVLCILLVMLSSLAFATVEMQNTTFALVYQSGVGMLWLATAAVAFALRRLARNTIVQPIFSPIIVCIMFVSCLQDPIARWIGLTGRPFEMLIGFSLQNSLLALAAAGCWRSSQGLAVSGALFLQVFALTLLPSSVWPITACFVAVGLIWIMSNHWEQIDFRIQNREQSQGTSARLVVAGLIGILITMGSVELITDRSIARQISGWLPSSGGTGEYDPFSRDGVGDGDALVAGSENIQSFAPIEEAPFKASDEPSLYDVYNDVYDEPVVTKNKNRAIALPPQVMEEICCRMAKSELAGKQFSTLRGSSNARRSTMKDLKSEALFYVAGRTPLHLRHELYDVFDGVTWYPVDELPVERLSLEEVDGRPWISLVSSNQIRNEDRLYGPKETHALKIAHLDTNRIPTPNKLLGIHIDQLDDLTMLREASSGMLELDGERIPSMLPIHLSSRPIDPEKSQQEIKFFPSRTKTDSLPDDVNFHRINELAKSWTLEKQRGFAQMSDVITHLRENFRLDPSVCCGVENTSPLEDFLFQSKAGPDYQFASAAAVLLRSLGYRTRLVSGYYVSPDKFERKSGHTPVHKEDLHFWAEVYIEADSWMTIEPTPGYEVLLPPPTFFQQIRELAGLVFQWAYRHISFLIVIALSVTGLMLTKAHWLDAMRTSFWRLWPCCDSREKIIRAQHILQIRFQNHGLGRRGHEPISLWMKRLQSVSNQECVDLETFAVLLTTLHYCDQNSQSNQNSDVAICEEILRHYSMRSIPRLFPKSIRSTDSSETNLPAISRVTI